MTSPYLLKSNSKAKKPAPNRSFIYVLSLNIDETHVSKPFFIGVSKNIAQTFARSKEADWHYKNFQKPIIVEIVGSVPDSLTEQATGTLKQLLVKAGCYIPSKQISARKATEYSKNKQPIFYDLTVWGKHNSAKMVDFEGNNVTVENQINVEDIIKYINYQQKLDTHLLNLALKIANSFEPSEGVSKIVFTGIKSKTDSDRLRKQLNFIRFIWQPKHKLKPYTVNEFKLTKPVIKEIGSYKKA